MRDWFDFKLLYGLSANRLVSSIRRTRRVSHVLRAHTLWLAFSEIKQIGFRNVFLTSEVIFRKL